MNVERINELARKAKTVGLTEEEKQEQAKLRKEYIASVVGDLRNQLDNTYVLDEKRKQSENHCVQLQRERKRSGKSRRKIIGFCRIFHSRFTQSDLRNFDL